LPSKLAAIARTTARSLELVTLHLDRPPHVLDALGSAAGLLGAEENPGDGSRSRKPFQEREHIAKQASPGGAATSAQPHATIIDAGSTSASVDLGVSLTMPALR
jgi:hypothetical protein